MNSPLPRLSSLSNSGHAVQVSGRMPIMTPEDLNAKANTAPAQLMEEDNPTFAHSLHAALPSPGQNLSTEHIATAFRDQPQRSISLVSSATDTPVDPKQLRELATQLHHTSGTTAPTPVVAHYIPRTTDNYMRNPKLMVQQKADWVSDLQKEFGRNDSNVILQTPDYFAYDHLLDKILRGLEGSHLRDALRISVSNSNDQVTVTLMPNVRTEEDEYGKYVVTSDNQIHEMPMDLRAFCESENLFPEQIRYLNDQALAHLFEEELRDGNNNGLKNRYIAYLTDGIVNMVTEGNLNLNKVGLISIETEGVLAGILKDEDRREALVNGLKNAGLPEEATNRILFNGILLGAPFVFLNEHRLT